MEHWSHQVILLLIAVELEIGQVYLQKYVADGFDLRWRTEPFSSTALEITCATKLSDQSTRECLILGRRHRLLHVLKASSISGRLVSPEILAFVRRNNAQRIDLIQHLEIFPHFLKSNMAQTVVAYCAVVS